MADHEEQTNVAGNEALPGIGELSSFSQDSLGAIVEAIKSCGNLPAAGEDHDLYYSFSDFREFRAAQGARLLSNIGNLLHHWKVRCHWPSDSFNIDPEGDELLDSLVEANDTILECVDTSLDEAAGLNKSNKTASVTIAGAPGQQGTPLVSSWNRHKNYATGKTENTYRFLMAKNIQRPQLKFKDSIDNSNTPFIPIIKSKPNALKPLQSTTSIESKGVPSAIADFVHQARIKAFEGGPLLNSTAHPYQYELEVFEPPENQMKLCKEQLYEELEKTPYTFVETQQQLEELSQNLSAVTEFAVDLEAHSYRSFQGFCCLMQISTRDHDYLIDVLELRTELHILNDSFTNPHILKVFHGADMDIGWLQRDFGIYVVNMFDTGQAARVLNYGKYSLAFLLKKFCDVTANKQYQLADWRIRPLPQEMVHYAREDTHYLLYISDRLHNELLKSGNANNNLLQSVYSKSKNVCLKRYEKPLFSSESFQRVLEKHKKAFNTEQVCAFRLLYAWRDNVAREEDESYGFVLPNHMMFQISQVLPRDPQGVLACCNPVPTLVKQYVNEIHQLIMQAKELALNTNKGLTGVSSQVDARSTSKQKESTQQRLSQKSLVDGDQKSNNLLLNGNTPFVSARPSPVGPILASGPPVHTKAKPAVSIFEICHETQLTDGQKKAAKIKASFGNPFQKFLPLKTPSATTEGKPVTDDPQGREEPDVRNGSNSSVEETGTLETNAGTKRKVSDDEETPEDLTPLRNKNAAKKPSRKKKRESCEEGSSTSNIHEKEGSVTLNTFDYSQADYSTFSDHRQNGSADKPIVFNPYRNAKKSKGPRSKVHMNSGQKNFTFSSTKGSDHKQKLPRR
ncbi:LOW QUALITY PROTEIN: exosome component 10-like [Acropora millepora]|uniref:LOW QUALITY PROTEIN: exosome component 10-like n=1 Tax=Acropora millepora TaxID=45264 RepID=UPI001CF51A59|nr:LOW QUALITY PROTEIN: exosome component 10-like [Acropora millepora]